MEGKRGKITLKYFKGIRGRGEMMVVLLKLAGVEYDDVRYDLSPEWGDMKSSKSNATTR